MSAPCDEGRCSEAGRKAISKWREIMVSKKVKIINPTGLHLRPAGMFCNTAVKFKSKVLFQHGTTQANAKSVLRRMRETGR